MKWLLHELPLKKPYLLTVAWLVSTAVGVAVDYVFDTRLDEPLHDEAVVSRPRLSWQHTAAITLDPGVPEYVSRKQSLPLFAQAAERVLNAGARAVFLDATLFESSPNMQYALCLDPAGSGVRWSDPNQVFNPLSPLRPETIGRFAMAPASPNVDLFTLFDLDTAIAIDPRQLFSEVRLYTRDNSQFSSNLRRAALHPTAATVRLAGEISPDRLGAILARRHDDVLCGDEFGQTLCRRLRYSSPAEHVHGNPAFPIYPISEFAGCGDAEPPHMEVLRDRVVILQMTSLEEISDVHITPMTTAFLGPRKLTHGSLILADVVEMFLADDQPRRPVVGIRILLIALSAFLGVIGVGFLKTVVALGVGLVGFALTAALGFWLPLVQLWPLVAATIAGVLGFVICLSFHMVLGTRQGLMMARYLPAPVRSMLLSPEKARALLNKKIQVVVVISDVKGYTTVTNLLKDPAMVFRLINEYFEETTVILQEKFQGWLETYIGDEVCFYWPITDPVQRRTQMALALEGALVQSELQRSFFRTLKDRYHRELDVETLEKIGSIIDAGIGISMGEVMMGNIGPNSGVQKFGILGDPLNLTSRIEGLTRFFNAEIIVTEELVDSARELGLKVRRLARVKAKGRLLDTDIFALGKTDDPRFNAEAVRQWDAFYRQVVETRDAEAACPEIFAKDAATLKTWLARGLLDPANQVWVITEK